MPDRPPRATCGAGDVPRWARRGALTAIVAVATALVAFAAWIAWPVPPSLLARDAGGVTLLDREGRVLRVARDQGGARARWIAIADADPDLLRAFIATEDRRFDEHHGVDARAIGRAVRDALAAGRIVSGASTITMQAARLLGHGGAGWLGKLSQAAWSLRLEAHLSKAQILEQYLNRVELGQGTVGVGAAAQLYFGASPAELSVGQAALLAGIARSPSRENPITSASRARARRALALGRMRRAGMIGDEEVAAAEREPLLGAERRPTFAAPHFTTRALAWLRTQSPSEASRAARVRTSLDLALQEALEADVRRTVEELRGRGVRHAAAVVVDNATGEILAWVGSPDFWADSAGQTDMVASPRQPGSALKPFLYALAFDRGLTPATVIPDVPRTFGTVTGPYRPRNYDHRFHGPVRAREALASSYNVPAVVLAERLGVAPFLATLRAAGFASLSRGAEHYGLGLALGNGDVTLLELANGYRALANGGEWRPWRWRVSSGAPERATGVRVASAASAALVLDILRDPDARVPGFGLETPFDFPFPTAVKTGTSRHFTDNWAVGVTAGFTVAVWAGNFSGRPMDGVSGVTGAGPLLRRAVMLTAARHAPGRLTTPAAAGATPAEICRLSGMLATPECGRMTEWFTVGTVPARPDDWERGGRLSLPPEYAEWLALERREDARLATTTLTTASDSSRDRRFRIVAPLDGDRYRVPPGVDARYATIALRAGGAGSEAGVRWFVDGSERTSPRLPLARGAHRIRALAASGEAAEVRVVVE